MSYYLRCPICRGRGSNGGPNLFSSCWLCKGGKIRLPIEEILESLNEYRIKRAQGKTKVPIEEILNGYFKKRGQGKDKLPVEEFLESLNEYRKKRIRQKAIANSIRKLG